ncbi:hypothetical protein C8Q74DRAFT_1215220 [Fomes fomentarius]|nr:hypothetical protein C8Q74DRAFT_1215220 [Fomes fomentarius]
MPDDSHTAQLVKEYSSSQIDNYAVAAVLCLLAYEYIITFDREMKFFWRQKITGSSVLFIVGRYLTLVFAGLDTMSSLTPTTINFKHPHSTTLFRVFSALRAYALSSGTRGQWFISTFVLLLALAPLITNFVDHRLIWVIGQSGKLLKVTIISRVCLITSDLLVVCVTWKATYKTSREIKVLGQQSSLSSILFKNGHC